MVTRVTLFFHHPDPSSFAAKLRCQSPQEKAPLIYEAYPETCFNFRTINNQSSTVRNPYNHTFSPRINEERMKGKGWMKNDVFSKAGQLKICFILDNGMSIVMSYILVNVKHTHSIVLSRSNSLVGADFCQGIVSKQV